MSIKTNGENFALISNIGSARSGVIYIDGILFGINQYLCCFKAGIFNNQLPKPKI